MVPSGKTFVLALMTLGSALTFGRQADWSAAPAADFPLPGGSLSNDRFSTLSTITPASIGRLGGAWMVHVMDGTPGNMQATPVVVGGMMYLPIGRGGVLALDAATGAVKWKHPPADAAGRGVNRGVVAADGKVFTPGGGNALVALDAKDGSQVWTTAVGDRGTIEAPPIYYDGKVFVGVSGGESGVRGFFGAFDANTGKQVWGFWTTPGPGEPGHDTWEGDSWMRGGAPVWTHVAIDPTLGTVYVPTGNASPDFDGSVRGGDNLYTSSILALDVKTGAYKWHFQEVHHDVWDYDNMAAPVLADLPYEGQTRKVVIHTGKTGYLYILDRTNGKPLIGINERDVPQEPRIKTARTQPIPIGDAYVPTCPEPGSVPAGTKSGCLFSPYYDEPVVIAPGTEGGVTWAPLTYSPQTRLVYVPGSIINSAFAFQAGFSRPANSPRAGTLTAMDPTTNKIVWQKRMKYPIGGGSGLLSTASGLLFHGESDGRLVAYDIRNGNELWSFQTGAGANAPVVTYAVGGEQYVAILAGGNANFQLSQPGDNLWAFKIGGTVPPATAPAEPPVLEPVRGRGAGRAGTPPGPGAPAGRQ